MRRRPDPCQLFPSGMERAATPAHPVDPPAPDPWAHARLDVLAAAFVDGRGYGARALARTLACSPATVARLRAGHAPRSALRGRLSRLAWRELGPGEREAAHLAPRPVDNLRWYAWRRFEGAHAFELEPIAPEVSSLCGYRVTRTVSALWSTTPEGFASLCPRCLALSRQRSVEAAEASGP